MSLERGSFSFRIFKLQSSLPHNVLQAFEKNAVPSFKTVSEEPVTGWVGGRHLMDLPINEESAYSAGYLKLTLLTVQKKIPASLLKAECKMQELMLMKEKEKPFLTKAERSEIRRDVSARLLKQMPLSLRGISFVVVEGSNVIYADCLSALSADLFKTMFIKTTRITPIMITPEILVAELAHMNVRDWQPTSFSPHKDLAGSEIFVGREFLMWLWFYSEARSGILKTEKYGEIAIMIDCPLVMAGDNNEEEIVFRHSSLSSMPEIKTSLLSGKRLKRATVVIATPEKVKFTFLLEGDTFVIKSLKIEETNIKFKNQDEYFYARIQRLEVFRDIFYELFYKFVRERTDKNGWKNTLLQIHNWILSKK